MLSLLPLALAAQPAPPPPPQATWEDARSTFELRDARSDQTLGFGSTLGLQGIFGVQIGYRFLGVVNPTLTLSLLRTADLTVRANVLPTRWTPQVGAGFVWGYPYDWTGGSTERCGFPHYDLGVEYTSRGTFSLDLGVTIADLDGSTGVNLVPVPYVTTAWYYRQRRGP